jgi:hypothetical protein
VVVLRYVFLFVQSRHSIYVPTLLTLPALCLLDQMAAESPVKRSRSKSPKKKKSERSTSRSRSPRRHDAIDENKDIGGHCVVVSAYDEAFKMCPICPGTCKYITELKSCQVTHMMITPCADTATSNITKPRSAPIWWFTKDEISKARVSISAHYGKALIAFQTKCLAMFQEDVETKTGATGINFKSVNTAFTPAVNATADAVSLFGLV